MKNNGNSKGLHLIAFILFAVWGVGTLINIVFLKLNVDFSVDGRLLTLCAFIVMFYCALLFYLANRKNKFIFWLFWISFAVGVAVVVLPFVNI